MIWLKLLVVTLNAVAGWILAALQYRPNWKDGRTVLSKRARKALFVLLPCAFLASLGLTYWDHRNSQEAQTRLDAFIQQQQATNIPKLVALSVTRSKNDYILKVKNIGTKPATSVKVMFSEDSTPNAFAGNLISGAKEIPNGTEYNFPLNLFSGINRIMNYPNSEPGYKEALEASLKKFNAGDMAFIPRFYLEYYDGEQKLTSPIYYLVLDSRTGLLSFGKEQVAGRGESGE